MVRPNPVRDEPADDAPDRRGAEDEAPCDRAAEMVASADRAEDDVHPDPEIPERVAKEAGGEPAVASYFAPAVAKLGPEMPGYRADVRLHPHRRDEDDAEQEARRVDREHPCRPGGRDDRTRRRRT